MGSNTPKLGLYKPGGGSTGLNGTDEVVDIDLINQNFDLIDSYAATTDTDVDSLDAKINRMGRAAASDAARNLLVPSPVAGDAVFRTDKGYTERYYTAYHATTNKGGATPAGWYPEPGADIYGKLSKTDGFQTVTSATSVPVTGMALADENGGFTVASNRLRIPITGMYELVVTVYGSGGNTGGVFVGVSKGNNDINAAVGPINRMKRTDGAIDENREASGIYKATFGDQLGLAALVINNSSTIWGGSGDTRNSTGLLARYVGPPR